MKNLTAILLTLLVLFNALGFYTVFMGWEYKNESRLLQSFDHGNYATEHEVSISIPVSIPYAVEQTEFQRVDGEFEYNGEKYRLVKQKYSNDTLHIICVRDVEGKRIHKALKDYVNTLAHQSGESKDGKISLSFLKDYFKPVFTINNQSYGWSSPLSASMINSALHSFYFADIVHPPERA